MMKFSIHNKLEIITSNKHYVYLNKMFKSIYEKYSTFEKFSNYVLIGDGLPSNKQNEFKLSSQRSSIKLKTDAIQNDTTNGQLYTKKSFVIEPTVLNDTYISEIGISDKSDTNTIYNYFSLIDEDNPKGIYKNKNEKLYGIIYIYLDITIESTNFNFLSGDNKFISYLLGEGMDGNIHISPGDYYFRNNNEPVFKPKPDNKIGCKIETTKDDAFNISFQFSIKNNIINSLFLFLDDKPFAVIKTQNYYDLYENTSIFTPKQHYIIDLGADIKDVVSVINNTTNNQETGYFITNYANEIGTEIDVDNFNKFNNQTPKFISSDGRYIAFVSNKNVYLYENENYKINEVNTHHLSIEEINNICIVDNYIFIFTKIEPYVFVFEIFNKELFKVDINSSNFNNLTLIKYALKSAVAKTNDNNFMIGLIDNEQLFGHTLYFFKENNSLVFDKIITSKYNFSYILAISSNNFCDAQIMYCKEGDYSYTSRLVTHYYDKTEKDVYSSLAYIFSHDTKELYVKGRGVVVEKTTSPKIQIYHYPQVYQYLFPDIENEKDYYLSNNLLYMAVRKNDNTLHFYNLVGYNESFEFANKLPDFISSTALDIVFLYDSFLVFTSEKIYAFNLKQNSKLIENISSNTDNYSISYTKYNFLGENNEEVVAEFSVTINI